MHFQLNLPICHSLWNKVGFTYFVQYLASVSTVFCVKYYLKLIDYSKTKLICLLVCEILQTRYIQSIYFYNIGFNLF